MTDITKLANKWRGEAGLYDPFCCTPAIEGCADDLEAALPKWTKVTEDKATWPDEGKTVMFACRHSVDGLWCTESCYIPHPIHKGLIGDYWRPICGLDYPD